MRHQEAYPADQAADRNDGGRHDSSGQNHRPAKRLGIDAEACRFISGKRQNVKPPAKQQQNGRADDKQRQAGKDLRQSRPREGSHDPEGD